MHQTILILINHILHLDDMEHDAESSCNNRLGNLVCTSGQQKTLGPHTVHQDMVWFAWVLGYALGNSIIIIADQRFIYTVYVQENRNRNGMWNLIMVNNKWY